MIKNYSSIRLSGRFLTSKRVCTVMLLFFGYTAQSLAQVSNCVVPPANALLNTNNSVNTCGVFDTIDPADQHVIGLIDVASAVADAAGNGVAPRTDAADVTATTGMTKNPAWLIGNLGNLYGVSIDEDTAEFYAAASSNYASSYGFGASQRDAILNYGTLGGGDNATGAGAIYKFDAVTGNPTLFATLPQATVSYTALNCEARAFGTVTSLPATGDQSRTNVGVGLGNIVWDTARDQLFAVNWEDGRIYRLDASGNILDAYDPDGTNNDIDAGFAGLDIPYGLALSPDGSSLFYGTMDRRVMSIDLTGAGGFPGTSSPVTVAGVNFNSFEDATETLHYTVTDSVDPDLTLFISDLEFTPTGDLIIGTRSGCPALSDTGDYSNAFASSYNHDAETLIVQDNGAGLFNANVIIPNISYDTGGVTGQYGAPAQGNDGYGGVDYYVAPDGTFEYVFSYGDIIQESSPHGIAVFPSEDAADATPVNPLGGISYYTGADGLLDVKGVGGDVQVYQQFSCPAVGSWTGNVSEDTTGDSNGDTNLSNVTLMLFLDADGDGVADGPAIATTTTDGSGNYSFDNLLPNNYVVMQTQPAGLGSISEDEGGADNDQNEAVPTIDNKITGTVDAGETDSNNDFIEVAASGGSLCYGATEAAQQIFTIDPTSGDAVFLGTSGVGFIEAMAFVPIPNGTTTLYAANAGQLGTIALTGPNVGQFTALPSTFGSGLDDVDSLSYDPMTGIFYGVDRNAGNGAGAQQDVVFQIDLATGQAVANTLFPVDLVQNEAGTATYGEVDDIAIDPVTGVMYAVINAGSASAGVLAIIDPTDGSATTVGDLGAIDIESLSFDSVGNLFATDGASGVNSPTSVMFSVDKDTGEATFVGPVQSNGTGYTDVEALACLTDPVEYGSWTGNVAEDLDNDSAINDPGDAPIANVTITLFEDTNGDGQPDDINDPFLTTTTNGSGDYSFTNVFPGDYVAVQTQPAGFVDVVEDEGGADNDQPDNGTVNSIAGTVSPGENDDNNDFVEERLGSWTGNVSEDTTGDGNGDTPISGVTITLFTDPNGDGNPADGTPVGTQTTNGSGDYTFIDLLPGDYVAVETQPAGYDDVSENEGGADNDQPDNGIVNSIAGTVTSNETDINNDFVEELTPLPVAIGSFVFLDTDGDGSQQLPGGGFEPGITGVTVQLLLANGNPAVDLTGTTVPLQTTGADGLYFFNNLPEGDYQVQVTPPAGHLPTINQSSADDQGFFDSNIAGEPTPGTYISPTITLTANGEGAEGGAPGDSQDNTNPGQNSGDTSVDFGFVELGSWSGNVSEDTTGDGNGDAPISGVTVELFTDPNGDGDPADGVSVGTQTTDGSGDYAFTGLAPGDYVAVETQPANLDNISQDEGGVDDDENTATVVVNQLSGTVAPGEDDANNDFVEGAPAIRLEKSLVAFDAANDVNGNGFPDENDTLSYSFTVFNEGVTDLSNITISDAKLGLVNAACAPGTIAVGGAPITCTFEDSYTITAADVTAGYVVNTATTDGDSTSPVDNTPGTPVSDVSDTGTQPSDPENVTDEPTPETTNTTDPDPAIPNSSDPEDDPTTALLTPAGSWSGNVSEDTTGDGNGDAPISGVTVELFTDPNGDGDPADGVSVGTQTTDGSGDYAFTGLAPGDYVAVETQPANLDNISQDEGGVDDDENTATVVVNQLSGTVAPGEDDANNDFVEGAPAIRLEKSLVAFDAANDVNGNGFPDENDTLSYSFTVFNEGVTDLSNITISDAKLGLVNAACAPGTIAVGGAPITCTFEDSYTITAADVTAGYVVNTATTDGDSTSPVDNTPGTPVSDVSDTGTQPSDPENVTDEPTPETTNTTDPDPAIPNSSDPEDDPTTALLTPAGSWSGNVSEDTTGDGNGDAPISGVTVELFTDPNGDGDPADGVSVGTQTTDGSGDYAFTGLAPGDYVAVETQPANLDNISQDEGGVDDDENTATVVVNQLSGTVAPGEDDANNDFVEGAPAIRLEKSLVAFDAANDVNGNGFPDENDTLSYSFTVFNEGVTDLSNITISDAKLGLVNAACAPGTIAVGGAPITCTFEDSYTITAADVTAGYVVNTATTDGDSTSPVDNTPGTPVSDVSDTGTQPSDPENVTDEPTPETTNTTDPDPAIPNSSDPEDDPTTALLTPAGSWSGNVSEDTTGDGNGDAPISGVTVELFTDPNGDGDPADGVSVGTQTTDGSGDYAFTGLAPGDYVAVETQPANLDNISQDEGGVDDDENTATVVVNQLSGTVAPGEDDANNDFVEGAPAIRLEKSLVAFDAANDVNGNGFPDENDTLSYSFTVFNEGVTDLSNITISDAKLGLVNAACAPGTIAVGGAPITCTFEDSYTITAADVTAGYVVNTATTDGDSTSPVDNTPGTPVSDVSDTGTQPSDPENVTDEPTPETTNTTDPDPAIPNSSDPEDDPTTALLTPAGSWSGNVSEDTTGDGNGDAPISGVTVELFTDPNGDGDPADGVSVGTQTTDGSGDYAFTGLAPGDYVAVETQPANLDNISQDEGGVDDDENTATVVVNQLSGTVAPGEDDANNDFVEGAPAIRLEKSLVAFDAANDVNGNGFPDENDTLSYSFTVFNEGVTDLSNITISDAKLGLVNAACAPGTIAVGGAPITCTFEDSYTITAADVTAGYVVNTATTDGDSTSPVDNTPGTPVSDVSDTGTQPSDPENVTDEPTPETTNTTDPDPAIPNSSDPEDDPTTALLTPAGSWSGNVSEDTTGDGNGDAPISGVTVELFTDPNGDGDPADGVSVGTQTTDGSGDYAFTGLAPGDYVAVETQPANLDNISEDEGGADDDQPDNGTLNSIAGTVAPGEDDANNDFVEGAPAIRLEKSLVAFDAANDVNGNGSPDENDTLSYSFTVFNDGVTDLSNITISDAKLGLVNAACAPGTIAVGGAPITCTFEDSYTITAADVTAGYVVNTATTDGDSTSPVDNTPGTPVSDVSDTGTQPSDPENVTDEPTPETTNTTDPDPAIPNSSDPGDDPTTAIFNNPSISLIKSIASVDWTLGNNAFIFDENDEITYEFLVINDGTEDVAVAANAVSDGMLTNIVCIPATLTPGDSTTCTADPYVLTATDIANGGVENTADVTGVPVNCICPPTVSDVSDTGTDPDADPITDPETTETPNDFLVHPNDVNDPTDDPTTIMFSAVTTPATLSFVSSENLGGNTVEVKWKTDVETGNVGFMIYQRLDSGWEEVNEELIPSKSFSGIGSSGNSYQYTSTQFESSWYAIADVDDQEKVTLYGPYFVGKTYGAEEVRTEVMDWSNVDTSKQLDKQSIKDRLERLRKK